MYYPLKSARRIPELDGLRGVAVIMVLAWHFVGSLLGGPAYKLTIFGRTGVDLFFVLSGFLIIGILIDNRDSKNLFAAFYTRRVARIFPAYFLLIAAYWLCFAVTGPNVSFNAEPSFPVQFSAQALFGFNWLMALYNGPVSWGFAVTWSVALEEQFYLIAPLVIWLMPPRLLLKALIIIGLSSAVARGIFYFAYPKLSQAAYILPPFRLDCLCAGGVVAALYRDRHAMEFLSRRCRQPLLVVAGAGALLAPVMVAAILRDLEFHMNTWGHLYLAAFYALLLLLVISKGAETSVLRHPILLAAGRVSYGLYLFHPLFICLFFTLANRGHYISTVSDAALAIGALGTCIVFCHFSFTLIERPIQEWGHRTHYQPTARSEFGSTVAAE